MVLVKPRTFMNRSGRALANLAREEPFEPAELLVCYDDFHLPLGRLRLRPAGSHGGHNGMRSIIDRLGTGEFPRLRVGVGPEGVEIDDATEFVLGPFQRDELPRVEEALERAADAVECALAEGLTSAMNRYNPNPEP